MGQIAQLGNETVDLWISDDGKMVATLPGNLAQALEVMVHNGKPYGAAVEAMAFSVTSTGATNGTCVKYNKPTKNPERKLYSDLVLEFTTESGDTPSAIIQNNIGLEPFSSDDFVGYTCTAIIKDKTSGKIYYKPCRIIYDNEYHSQESDYVGFIENIDSDERGGLRATLYLVDGHLSCEWKWAVDEFI